MDTTNMKLYGSFTSPFVRHCRIALLEANLACEFIETDAAASAVKSPTKKVPFFEDGAIALSDSSSILKYLREINGGTFCADAREYDQLCLVNTLMEAAINLFFLERDGITPTQSAYLTRHSARIESGLAELKTCRIAYRHLIPKLSCAWGVFWRGLNYATGLTLVNSKT